MGLIRLLIRGPLQIANYPKRIIVGHNEGKANIVAHACGQFLGRVEKTSVADQADDRGIRPRYLDAYAAGKLKPSRPEPLAPMIPFA